MRERERERERGSGKKNHALTRVHKEKTTLVNDLSFNSLPRDSLGPELSRVSDKWPKLPPTAGHAQDTMEFYLLSKKQGYMQLVLFFCPLCEFCLLLS